MHEITELSKIIASMPVEGLIATIVLAGFGLAAFAIYAVMTVAKERH
jgi:hypothetical protein